MCIDVFQRKKKAINKTHGKEVLLTRTSLFFCAAQLVFSAVMAMEGPPPILNPTTYTSPSGVYSLTVNPSDLHGRGSADYRFTMHGKLLWNNRMPYTFWEAGIADSGYIGGYSYSNGWRGFSKKGFMTGMGDFRVVILSPSGEVLKEHVIQREHSRFLDTPPSPLAKGLFIDTEGARVLIRVADSDINKRIEQWWVYSLKNGMRLDPLEPQSFMATAKDQHLSIIDTATVASTPLVLVHWWKSDYPRAGAVFTLVNESAKPVWTLSLDNDYSVPSDEDKEDEIRRRIWEHGGILGVDTNGIFHLHSVKQGLRISYGVKKSPSGEWEVTKIAQSPYTWDNSGAKKESCPSLTPAKIGELVLSSSGDGEKRKIGDLKGFDFDQRGDICATRFRRNSLPSLLLVSQSGELIYELALPVDKLPENIKISNPANIGEKRFVVAVSDQAVNGIARWFIADFGERTVEKLTDTTCPSVEAVAGFPDGSFAALTTRHMKYTSVNGLFFFDRTGRQLLSKEERGYSGFPDDLLSPKDITHYGINAIAVLDNIRHTIQIFDKKCVMQKSIDLQQAWGRKPSYPTDISADRDGGFIVYDFDAKHTLLRLDRNGKILTQSVPRFQDKRAFSITDGVKWSPQGDLWTCDGESLLRLSTNSTVNLILGEKPLVSVLKAPDYWWVGPEDHIYVSDRRTKCLHIFNSLGKHLGQCKPKAEDLTEHSFISHVSASRNGHIFLTMDLCSDRQLHFNEKQNHLGWSGVKLDSVCQDWYFQPTNDLCWIVGYNDVFLVRGLKNVERRISRRPDGRWLEYPGGAAVAHDGSLALLARTQSREMSINIYDCAGKALSTFPVPDSTCLASIAYDGSHVYIRQEANVMVYGPDGSLSGSFALKHAGASENWAGPFLASQGRELWFVSTDDLTIHRYTLPR